MKGFVRKVVINISVIMFTLAFMWTSNVFVKAAEEDFVKFGVESPMNVKSDSQPMNMSGWVIAKGKITNVEVFIDGKSYGKANYGFYRADIGNAFPSYTDSYNSGFTSVIPDNLSEGKHIIDLKVSVIDTNNKNKDVIVEKPFIKATKHLPSRVAIDNLKDQDSISGDYNISGWALANTGINKVEVLIDDVLMGNAQYGYPRKDVADNYKDYFEADNCGYNFKIKASSLSAGKHSLKVRSIGNNNELISTDVTFFYNLSLSPKAAIDISNDSIVSRSLNVSGWALNSKNVDRVKVYFDWKYIGDANYGFERKDIANAFKDYPNSLNSGFNYTIDLKKYEDGNHSIMVQPIGKDGTIYNDDSMIRNIVIANNTIFYGLDDRLSNINGKLSANISGWATSTDPIKDVNIFVDWNYVSKATYGYTRNDIQAKYTALQGKNIGFSYNLDLLKYAQGNHTLMVQFVTQSGIIKSEYFNFNVKRVLIVVDPGHNNGGDDGAYATIDGKTYCERDLNMKMAVKVKKDLEDKGYTVVLTRQPWEVLYDSSHESLAKRVNYANDLNADLFISIHHDKSDSESASGVSTHYSSFRPDLDNDGIVPGTDPGGWSYDDLKIDTTPTVAAARSRDLANKLVANLSSSLGRSNLKAHDHGLYVTRYAKMPSVLIECGYISNKKQAEDCSNDALQEKTAQIISDTVATSF